MHYASIIIIDDIQETSVFNLKTMKLFYFKNYGWMFHVGDIFGYFKIWIIFKDCSIWFIKTALH